jgi:4-hydroxy-2-oxoheptanedioate aldolase
MLQRFQGFRPMRRLLLPSVTTAAAMAMLGVAAPSPVSAQPRLNPVIDLLAAGKPVFGLYAPANRRARPGTPPPPADSMRTPAQLAAEALAYPHADYVFDGSMEGNFDAGYATFAPFARGMAEGGALKRSPAPHLTHPLFVKTPEIAPDPALARDRIRRQLDLGVSGIVFVSVESADELRGGIAAMRFASQGGTRPDDVGDAPARWGMSAAEYRARADVWPLNPKGELVNFAIVESKAGLERVREIAAVPGLGVLFPGAGTLRGVFTTTGTDGQRVFDEAAWEAAIQQVLAACKEFKVPCGYPAGAADIERRLQQGFSVFVINWGEQGFRAVELGRAASGRRD